MIEFMDMLIYSNRAWVSLLWCWMVGAVLLALAGRMESTADEDNNWFLIPGLVGAAVFCLPTAAAVLVLFARFTAYVFGGV